MSARREGSMNLLAIIRDIGFVSLGKYGQYIVTFVTLPLTARVLGTEGVGLLAIGMSGMFIGSLIGDLGITSFLAARVRESGINHIRASYCVIRVVIALLFGVALIVGIVAQLGSHVVMVLYGLFIGAFSSVSEDWLLIGRGRFGASMIYQSVGRVIYLVLLFVWLPQQPSAFVAMTCLLLSMIPTVALTWVDSFRHFGGLARPSELPQLLRLGAPVLTSRLLVASYGQGAPAVYSAVLNASSLGLYSASDRVVRAVQSLLDPIGLALLPRMAGTSGDEFWQRSKRVLYAVIALASAATVAIWVTAPLIVRVIFGEGFDDAIPMLRVEAIILPATAVTSFVVTAVLAVLQDTIGVLIGGIVGTVIAGIALILTAHTHSVWTLLYGTIAAEVTVAIWYAFRMWQRGSRRGAQESAGQESLGALEL